MENMEPPSHRRFTVQGLEFRLLGHMAFDVPVLSEDIPIFPQVASRAEILSPLKPKPTKP